MENKELIKHTNKIFSLFINDLKEQKGITVYRIAKDLNFTRQFFYNKINNHSNSYVGLVTIYKISKFYDFDFSLMKYEKQLN